MTTFSLESSQIGTLVRLLEEATRSTDEGVRRFMEPADGVLARATSRRNHIIFGRRGSGKSSLLRKVVADLTLSRTPVVMVDLETFKGHEYPDVLLSVLIKTFESFEQWLRSAAVNRANYKSFWSRLFGSAPTVKPLNRASATRLADLINASVVALTSQLHQSTALERSDKIEVQSTEGGGIKADAKLNTDIIDTAIAADFRAEQKSVLSREDKYAVAKVDFLKRHILHYQDIFVQMSKLASGASFLLLDDLYHIKRRDQANLLDYFHRIGKPANLYLKIGTVKHRSSWYINGDPPIGMKIGDEMDDIDLDLTLDKFALTKSFLVKLANQLVVEAGIPKIQDLINAGGLDRLVLASGGVVRDFFGILRRAINVAREQAQGSDSTLIGAEQVNSASGEYESTKREEFKKDTIDEEQRLLAEFNRLKAYCFDTSKANVVLMEKDSRSSVYADVQELVDLRLVHKIRSRVTVRDRTGRLYEAYMLDLSQYSGVRARRNFDIVKFWGPQEQNGEALRKPSFIYEELLTQAQVPAMRDIVVGKDE